MQAHFHWRGSACEDMQSHGLLAGRTNLELGLEWLSGVTANQCAR
jgi:hypothetical protein